MAKIPATEFKAKCLELMNRVAERRTTYVITKRGKPVAMLVPLESRGEGPLFGRLRGMAEEVSDIVGPVVAPEAWQTLEEWDELHPPQSQTKPPAPKARKSRRR
jgi:prevent-host-death family protein